jgi:dTDP-4-dehydrorhamnose reductase
VRVFVTGAQGQLGTALLRCLAARGARVTATDLELDVADADAVEAALLAVPGGPPEMLLNAAAFTAVDRCEREQALAERINAAAPAGLARVCRARGVRLVHVSTDYVFAGDCERPYREEDPPAPRSAYGRTKLAGERAVLAESPDFLVVRTSWLFGRGRNFMGAILAQAQAGRPLRVVDDQTGRPTYAADLAEGLLRLALAGRRGLYHVANAGVATWWDVARATLDLAGYGEVPVEPIHTDALRLDAPRPRFSVLDCSKAEREGIALRPWRDALADYLASEDAPPGVRRIAGEGAARRA